MSQPRRARPRVLTVIFEAVRKPRKYRHLAPLARHRIRRARAAADRAAVERLTVRVPPGRRLVTDRAEAAWWLSRATAPTRADAAANRLAVAHAVALFMDADGMIQAGHDRIGARAGAISRACAGSHVRALVEAGVLVVVEGGLSAQASGLPYNKVSVYAVLAPDDELWPGDQAKVHALADALSAETKHPHVGVVDPVTEVGRSDRRTRTGPHPGIDARPEAVLPRGAWERWRAISWWAGALELDFAYFRAELADAYIDFRRRGWTIEAAQWGATHSADGTPDHDLVKDARNPIGALRARLRRHRAGGHSHGTPSAPPVLPVPRAVLRRQQPPAPPLPPARTASATGLGEAARAAVAAVRAQLTSEHGTARVSPFRRRGHLSPLGLT